MDRLAASSAFDAALAPLPRAGADAKLAVSERADFGIARVMAGRGKATALRECVRDRFGVDLPDGPRLAESGGVLFAGVGPGAWLAIREGGADRSASLSAALSGAASVVDQSGAYAVLRLAGPAAADILSAGAFIDFHADAFPAGGVAVTQIALIDAVILRRADHVFDVAVFRSFAPDFWRFMEETAPAWGVAPARA